MFSPWGLTHQAHGLAGLLRRHIVQQDGISPCCERLVELCKILYLHFNLLQVRYRLPCQAYSCRNPTSDSNMIVFNEDSVSQTEAMVMPTPNLHGVLFEQPESWRRLTSIKNTCLGMPHCLDIAPGGCRYP